MFIQLLGKIDEQRKAYSGKVFDVLGEAFADRPLRELLVEAIRYGDQPDVQARLQTVIDQTVGDGLAELIAERALHREVLATADLDWIRRQMEDAQARRLQPHYVEAFFVAAFSRLGGRISRREAGRYEVTHVPGDIRDRDRLIGTGAPVIQRYERITFDRDRVRVPGSPRADLLTPGHPLLDAVVDLTIERHRSTLKQGTVLVDRDDPGEAPRLLVALTQAINDGHSPPRSVSKRFEFVEITPDGGARAAGPAPYLDYEPPSEAEADAVARAIGQPWLASGFEDFAAGWAIEHRLGEHLRTVEAQVQPTLARTRVQVRQRLTAEINYWDTRHAALLDQAASGRELRIRPETAYRRARELENRLQRREADLVADGRLTALPPTVAGGALVLPQGLVDRLLGRRTTPVSTYARQTAEVERRAVVAVLAAERALGRRPTEMPPNNPGYDIRSEAPNAKVIRIEVLTAKNLGADYRLVLVSVSPDGPARDAACYVTRPFDSTGTDDFRVTRFTLSWAKTWSQGGPPR